VISIETLLDVSTLSLEEAICQLRSAEEDGVTQQIADGKLYLTEQEWVERGEGRMVMVDKVAQAAATVVVEVVVATEEAEAVAVTAMKLV
jgi:hypothetical protein